MNMAQRFLEEHKKWIAAGAPLRTPERMEELFSICEPCEFYMTKGDGVGKCTQCGCQVKRTGAIINKLALATTRCPLPEPKWIEEDGYQPKPEDTVIEQTASTTPATPEVVSEVKKKGCGCAGS